MTVGHGLAVVIQADDGPAKPAPAALFSAVKQTAVFFTATASNQPRCLFGVCLFGVRPISLWGHFSLGSFLFGVISLWGQTDLEFHFSLGSDRFRIFSAQAKGAFQCQEISPRVRFALEQSGESRRQVRDALGAGEAKDRHELGAGGLGMVLRQVGEHLFGVSIPFGSHPFWVTSLWVTFLWGQTDFISLGSDRFRIFSAQAKGAFQCHFSLGSDRFRIFSAQAKGAVPVPGDLASCSIRSGAERRIAPTG